eukprot:15468415-Alexandrium_andersonii.AAC.1
MLSRFELVLLWAPLREHAALYPAPAGACWDVSASLGPDPSLSLQLRMQAVSPDTWGFVVPPLS